MALFYVSECVLTDLLVIYYYNDIRVCTLLQGIIKQHSGAFHGTLRALHD